MSSSPKLSKYSLKICSALFSFAIVFLLCKFSSFFFYLFCHLVMSQNEPALTKPSQHLLTSCNCTSFLGTYWITVTQLENLCSTGILVWLVSVGVSSLKSSKLGKNGQKSVSPIIGYISQ